MTPEVLNALRQMVSEVGADAGVLVRLSPTGSAVITSSTLCPDVAVGDAWGPPGALDGTSGRPELAVDPGRLATLVPAAVKLALPTPVSAALVAPLGDTMSRVVLLWAQSQAPRDVVHRLESESFRRFTLLAPLLDAQVQAEESASQLRAVVEALGQAVVLTATGSGTAHVNEAAAQLLGLSSSSAVDAADLSAALQALHARVIDPEVLEAEADVLFASPAEAVRDWVWTLQGMPSHLRVTTLPVETVTGRGRIWVFDDISAEMGLVERERRIGRALAESEARYRLLLDNTSEVVFQTVDHTLTWVSPALEEVTGWRPEDVVGGSTRHFWHPDDWKKAVGLREGAHRGAHGREVLRLRRPDGQHMWVEVTVRPYVEADGRPGTVGMMYDVTDRVLAQEAAWRSEERYRTVAENVSDVVCRIRADGVIDWVFGSTEMLVGRTAQELVGTVAATLFEPADLTDRAEIAITLARGEVVHRLARLRRADGTRRWLDLRNKAVVTAGGSIEYVISTWRDAQAEVEYREALSTSEREARELAQAYEVARNEAIGASTAKTAFLSRMSHELRTPLNAVLGFAQLLALDPLTQDQAEAVQHIRRGGRHLLDLINEVLDISRIEAGRLSLSMEVVDAGAVVAEVVDLVQPLAGEHQVSVTTGDSDGASVHVQADQQRVKQVLINLLSNGVKYNRTGGSVQVGCRVRESGEVAFDVTDTGPGVPAEMVPRLFQPFDRLGAEGTEVEGTGLGLALADGLARAMGGHIEVVTELGAGSTFTLVLQASTAGPALTESLQREPEVLVEGDLRILYVEDNPTNATLMSRVVALRPGCRLEVAPDGARGLAAARREAPDLVFLDLHLPDMHGEQVLRELRTVPACADAPVVVVTADASPGAREQMAELGSNGFLTKPINLDDVLGWIDGALGGGGKQ